MNPHKSGVALGGQFTEGQPLAHDGRQDAAEPSAVRCFALVVPERLFVQILLQMERSDGDVGAAERPLEQREEAFQAVRMDPPLDVFGQVVNELVVEVQAEPAVGRQGIGVDMRIRGDVGPYRVFIASRIRWSMNHAVF